MGKMKQKREKPTQSENNSNKIQINMTINFRFCDYTHEYVRVQMKGIWYCWAYAFVDTKTIEKKSKIVDSPSDY